MDLNSVMKRVEAVLDEFPQARNSDQYLIMVYFRKYHGVTTLFQVVMGGADLPSFESIRRTRQKIQMKGLYPADNKVTEFRTENEGEYREYARA